MFTVNEFLPTSPLSLLSSRRQRTNLIINNTNVCTPKPPALVYSTDYLYQQDKKEKHQRPIVIVILSARTHFMQRNLIRQTYGSIKYVNNINILAIAFMLGSVDAPESEKVEFSELNDENLKFGDIIMGDFVDSYKNLTRKSIMAYEWVSSFCRDAQFVVKTDDDVVLNIFKLTEELDALSSTEVTSSTIRCPVHFNGGDAKNVSSKSYVSPVDFPSGHFPKHCNGQLYVATMTVVDRLVEEISKSFLGRVCTHEDIFMTAIVPEKINSNFGWSKNEPIELIQRRKEWECYALDTEQSDDAEYLVKLLRQPFNETENFDEFLKRFGSRVFYLLAHDDEFEERYTRLWQIIVKLFQK